MKYRNTKTGQETNMFSDADWKSGLPQRYGWVKNEELKTMPKDIIDFAFNRAKQKERQTINTEDMSKKESEKKRESNEKKPVKKTTRKPKGK